MKWSEILELATNLQILVEIEEVKSLVADLTQSVENLQTAVTEVAQRVGDLTGPLQEQLAALEAALAEEREAHAAYVVSEDAEDVEQDATLADAQARVDQALADAQTAANGIDGEIARLNQVGQPQQ